MSRVGQNHVYTVYIRFFWLGNHQIYGVYIRVYTVLANPTFEGNKQKTCMKCEGIKKLLSSVCVSL
jgi:hypothetical protein